MEALNRLSAALRAALPELELREHEPMSRHTTFRTGGPARLWAHPATGEALAQVVTLARDAGVEPLLLGAGSNVLAPDGGLQTLVIQTGGMTAIRQTGYELDADCGVSLRRLATAAQQSGLTGLEFAHGIPGTVGGGVYMNAGAYGGELKDLFVRAELLTADGRRITRDALGLGYRHSDLMDSGELLLSARFALTPGDPAAISARMDELQAKRKASQPLEYPSAGSTFKRPANGYAAAMIDQAGCRGLRVGGAEVSEKHAGFVINRDGATSADILALMDLVRQRVFDAFGVMLEPEVRIL